jgi:ABC-2 type transport system ATP-binding protein
MTAAITLDRVTKTFGPTTAVRGFSLEVPAGALCGVIGPNGAGKTTLIRMILGILLPDSGRLSVLGCGSALEARDRIGYLPEERGLYRKMRVRDFLAYMARIKGMRDPEIAAETRSWLDRVGLGDAAGRRCEELSKGMQQKVQFITSVIHRPELLILDEPFSGLDPVNQRRMKELVLGEHRRGATVLFSTHIMQHAEELCDHVVMIHRGDKVLDGPLSSILESRDDRRILFEPLDRGALPATLGRVDGVQGIEIEGSAWNLLLQPGADLAEVIPALASAVTPARVLLRRPTLEDIFIDIVSGGGGEGGDGLRAGLGEGAGEGDA